jgi:hypothetical protein
MKARRAKSRRVTGNTTSTVGILVTFMAIILVSVVGYLYYAYVPISESGIFLPSSLKSTSSAISFVPSKSIPNNTYFPPCEVDPVRGCTLDERLKYWKEPADCLKSPLYKSNSFVKIEYILRLI